MSTTAGLRTVVSRMCDWGQKEVRHGGWDGDTGRCWVGVSALGKISLLAGQSLGGRNGEDLV